MDRLKKIVKKVEKKVDQTKYKLKEKLNLFDPVIIYPYRGYGNKKDAYIKGRILEKEDIIHDENVQVPDTLWNNIRKAIARYESDEIPMVKLTGEFNGKVVTTMTDQEGYFDMHFTDYMGDDLENGWHQVKIRIVDMPYDLEYEEEKNGEIFIFDGKADFGIISDVDDTIIVSDAMHGIKRILTMMKNDANGRVPFDGVRQLYEALTQHQKNPLFFVSGSSYNLYDMLIRFAELNGLPKAPFLLRDLGLDTEQWIKQETHPYKMGHIKHILNSFPDMPFILIGDSGQHDPEIYKDAIAQFPDRIKAVYIRHVLGDDRAAEIRQLYQGVSIPFILMKDSEDAMRHARHQGWI